MTQRHKWADVIIAFAEGKEIQFRSVHDNNPTWLTTTNLTGLESSLLLWRIKPTKKTYWVNVYRSSLRSWSNGCYKTEKEAITDVCGSGYIGTYPIEIEES